MKLRIERGLFKDDTGRTVVLRGINIAGDSKLPPLRSSGSLSASATSTTATAAASSSASSKQIWEDSVEAVDDSAESIHSADSSELVVVHKQDAYDDDSYVGTPFSLEEADIHFERIRKCGFNTVRYIFTWDALEHSGPGIYDDKYIDFTIEILKKLKSHGLMAFMDPHQDTWSRFSGGSGAPLWTMELLGLDSSTFVDTHSAIVIDGRKTTPPIKMLWASNYHRLVCQVMFTVFFAGEHFAPKCKVNGINVGKYLRDHYLDAVCYLARKIADTPELEDIIIGWESLNEPGHGLIAYPDITRLPDDPEHIKLGTSPTPYQAMLLGMGKPQNVEVWTFGSMGCRKQGNVTITPSKPVWFSPADMETIDKKYGWSRSWPVGCIWKYHGVYDEDKNNGNGYVIRPDYFTFSISGKPLKNHAFVEEFFVDHFMEYEQRIHAIKYDWFIFMQTPVNNKPPDLIGRGIVLDETRTVYSPHYYDGLTLMLKRWKQFNVDAIGVMRNHYWSPILAVRIGEKAIRNSMADQLQYLKSEGKLLIGENIPCLVSEIGIPYDLDGKRAYKTGEYSSQIRAMDANHNALESAQLHHTLWVYTANNSHAYGDLWNGEDLSIWSKDDQIKGINDGFRAGEAVIRPYPIAVNGHIVSYGFDITKALFHLTLQSHSGEVDSDHYHQTEIYLPEFYYHPDRTGVSTSSGTWKIQNNILIWKHASGGQTIRIRGVPKYNEQACLIM